jgi:hypothetical protein
MIVLKPGWFNDFEEYFTDFSGIVFVVQLIVQLPISVLRFCLD